MPGCVITLPKTVSKRLDLSFGILPDGVKNTVATHGVSVFNDPNEVTCRGFNAHKIDESSVPDTLKIQQRGQNKKHFEIMPREPMTLDAYTEALAKIVAN